MSVFASYTTRVDEEVFAYSTTTKEKIEQPFTVTSNCLVTSIDLYYLAKNGSPTGNVSASIYSDSSGSPGTLLETGTTIDASTLPARGTAGPQTSTFAGTLQLNAGTTYHLVLSKSSLDTTNYCWWGVGSTGRPWADYKVFSSSSWVAGVANYNCTFVLNGNYANYIITCNTASFSLTGIPITILREYIMACSTGSFLLSGINNVLTKVYTLVCETGSFILTRINNILRVSLWTDRTKPSTSWTNRTKPSTSFTDRTKPTTTWTKVDRF